MCQECVQNNTLALFLVSLRSRSRAGPRKQFILVKRKASTDRGTNFMTPNSKTHGMSDFHTVKIPSRIHVAKKNVNTVLNSSTKQLI